MPRVLTNDCCWSSQHPAEQLLRKCTYDLCAFGEAITSVHGELCKANRIMLFESAINRNAAISLAG